MLRSSSRSGGTVAAATDQIDADTDSGSGDHADVVSVASYIADMSAELAKLAGRSQLPMLAYFLNLARVEAEMRSRSLSNGLARADAERLRNPT